MFKFFYPSMMYHFGSGLVKFLFANSRAFAAASREEG